MILLEDTIENIKAMSDTRDIEIEADNVTIQALNEMIKEEKFITNIDLNHQTMTLTVDDLDVARLHLNKVIHEKKIMIKKMMIKEPTLEDIYMKVVKQI
ncbi:MAG: DUF4162 domain-containing protein, partial [Acholeplasmataceae bacterium]|nr:DUF4162 domain-containing protein [Acholeplasmataceae bacterium]